MKHFSPALKNLYNIFTKYIKPIFRQFCLFLIYFYRCFLSPYFGGACRFYPSCSEYSQQAFKTYSLFKAFKLSFKRVVSCRPFGGFGYHPLSRGCEHE